MKTNIIYDYNDYRQKIEIELAARVSDYKQSIAGANAAKLLGKKDSPLKLIADGDSWFDYPLGGTIPFYSHTDIIAQLPGLCDKRPFVLKLAHYGNATRSEVGLKRTKKIVDAIETAAKSPNGEFDAILFSGGGNDVVGDPFSIWLNDAAAVGNNPAFGLNQTRFNGVLDLIKASYLDLVALRDEKLPNAPIFVYGYDFAIPTGKPACRGHGPWLKPALAYCGWRNQVKATAIVKDALTQFGKLMQSLAKNPANNMIYVQTQGVLKPGDWANELHPKPEGFRKIALEFLGALKRTFSGRV